MEAEDSIREPTQDEIEQEAHKRREAAVTHEIRRQIRRDWTHSGRLGAKPSDLAAWDASLARDLIGRILEVIDPIKILLFGSAVRTDAENMPEFGPGSGIDLLIVVQETLNKRDIARKLYLSLRDLALPKDIVVVRESETATPLGVVASALEEGSVLYGRVIPSDA